MEYPKTLYVREKVTSYVGSHEIKELVGHHDVNTAVPYGNRETIAVYELVRTETYKKKEIRTTTLERI